MGFAIVELHDVSPYYYEETARALELFNLCGIEKYSLLVVPNFYEKYPLYKSAGFVRSLLATGQEIVLHGYTHRGGSLRDFIWTYREGEFSNLDLMETYNKLEKALEIMEVVGVKPEVFVPPAWLGNPHLEDLLYAFGFKAVAYRRGIRELERGEFFTSPVITFSNRPILSAMSLSFSLFMFRRYRKAELLRLALHTKDFRDKRKVKLWRFMLTKAKKKGG